MLSQYFDWLVTGYNELNLLLYWITFFFHAVFYGKNRSQIENRQNYEKYFLLLSVHDQSYVKPQLFMLCSSRALRFDDLINVRSSRVNFIVTVQVIIVVNVLFAAK